MKKSSLGAAAVILSIVLFMWLFSRNLALAFSLGAGALVLLFLAMRSKGDRGG